MPVVASSMQSKPIDINLLLQRLLASGIIGNSQNSDDAHSTQEKDGSTVSSSIPHGSGGTKGKGDTIGVSEVGTV